jgi:hypothetical protein
VIFGTVVGFVFYEPTLRVAAELAAELDAIFDEAVANAIRGLLVLPA